MLVYLYLFLESVVVSWPYTFVKIVLLSLGQCWLVNISHKTGYPEMSILFRIWPAQPSLEWDLVLPISDTMLFLESDISFLKASDIVDSYRACRQQRPIGSHPKFKTLNISLFNFNLYLAPDLSRLFQILIFFNTLTLPLSFVTSVIWWACFHFVHSIS